MPKGYSYPQEKIDKIIELYESGLNCGQIGRTMSAAKETIRSILVRNGVEIRKAGSSGELVTPETEKEWIDLYTKGISTVDIAVKYGVVKSTVLKKLRNNGIMRRSSAQARWTTTKQQELEIVELYKMGLSMEDCSKETKVSPSVVWRVLKNYEVDRSKGRRIKFRRKEEQEKIVRLYLQGWSLSMLESELETSRDSIKAVLRLHGIKVKSYGELKGFTFTDKIGREFSMNSGWEMRYAEYLDASGISWDYERESYRIGTRTYTPDFWIFDAKGNLRRLVEIKGWYTKQAQERVKLFRSYYPHIKLAVLREHDLKKIGVLK